MYILRLTVVIAMLLWSFSSCVKEVSYYEEEIPKGNIVMKNLSPQRVSDVMILEIVEIKDNRCPVGVVCSADGEVGVGFKAYVNGEFVNLDMNFDDLFGNTTCSATLEGHVIEILKVSPYPMSNDGINPNDYRIEIKVEKL